VQQLLQAPQQQSCIDINDSPRLPLTPPVCNATKARSTTTTIITTTTTTTLTSLPPQAQADPGRNAVMYDALKDDPELSHVFDDVKANGPGALQK
jgi:hypothetical protein